MKKSTEPTPDECRLYNLSLGGRPELRRVRRVVAAHDKRIHGERYPGPRESVYRRLLADEYLEHTRAQWLSRRKSAQCLPDCGLTLDDLSEMREASSQSFPDLDSFEMVSLLLNVFFYGTDKDVLKLRDLVAPRIKRGTGRPGKRDWRDDLLRSAKGGSSEG